MRGGVCAKLVETGFCGRPTFSPRTPLRSLKAPMSTTSDTAERIPGTTPPPTPGADTGSRTRASGRVREASGRFQARGKGLRRGPPRGSAPLTGTAVTAALLLATAAAVCAQDPALKAAVVKCVKEEPTGNCACAGTSCSTDARFQGPIGTWDVSGVEDMKSLFETRDSNSCTIYCDFNGNISAWDTSSVTTMWSTWVPNSPLALMRGRVIFPTRSLAGFIEPPASTRTSRSGTLRR